MNGAVRERFTQLFSLSGTFHSKVLEPHLKTTSTQTRSGLGGLGSKSCTQLSQVRQGMEPFVAIGADPSWTHRGASRGVEQTSRGPNGTESEASFLSVAQAGGSRDAFFVLDSARKGCSVFTSSEKNGWCTSSANTTLKRMLGRKEEPEEKGKLCGRMSGGSGFLGWQLSGGCVCHRYADAGRYQSPWVASGRRNQRLRNAS